VAVVGIEFEDRFPQFDVFLGERFGFFLER